MIMIKKEFNVTYVALNSFLICGYIVMHVKYQSQNKQMFQKTLTFGKILYIILIGNKKKQNVVTISLYRNFYKYYICQIIFF